MRLRQDRLRKIRIVYEDDDVLVVDKPAGLAVHGGADTKGRDLLAVLSAEYEADQALHLAHRLDRGTSGVLMLVKHAELTSVIQGLWPSASKRYLAITFGKLDGPRRIEAPLAAKDGRPLSARSDVVPLRSEGELTLVQVDITTGRQHQIRRHLAMAGYPVVMDDKYGDFAANKRWMRQGRPASSPRPKHPMLHAARLEVAHPRTGEPLTFEAPLPQAWRQWLNDATGP